MSTSGVPTGRGLNLFNAYPGAERAGLLSNVPTGRKLSFDPGEDREERPPHCLIRLPASAFRLPEKRLLPPDCFIVFLRLRGRRLGHLWPDAIPPVFLTALGRLKLSRSRESSFKGLWECKVTPATCSCQEGNTIGCILNNDGLGAGVVDSISTRGIHGVFTKGGWQWSGTRCLPDGRVE